MADYFRKPPIGTDARDDYDAAERRRRNRKCACGRKVFAGGDKCAWHTYPERMAALSRPVEFYRKQKP